MPKSVFLRPYDLSFLFLSIIQICLTVNLFPIDFKLLSVFCLFNICCLRQIYFTERSHQPTFSFPSCNSLLTISCFHPNIYTQFDSLDWSSLNSFLHLFLFDYFSFIVTSVYKIQFLILLLLFLYMVNIFTSFLSLGKASFLAVIT